MCECVCVSVCVGGVGGFRVCGFSEEVDECVGEWI